MKIFRKFAIALLTAGTLGLTVGGYAAPVMGAQPARASAASVYRLKVDGLACPYCAYGIEKEFKQTGKVKNVNIDIQKGQVVLHMKPGKRFSHKQVKQLVDDAGFTLDGMQTGIGASSRSTNSGSAH